MEVAEPGLEQLLRAPDLKPEAVPAVLLTRQSERIIFRIEVPEELRVEQNGPDFRRLLMGDSSSSMGVFRLIFAPRGRVRPRKSKIGAPGPALPRIAAGGGLRFNL